MSFFIMKGIKMQTTISKSTKNIAGIAIFSALAFIVAFVCQVIPPVAGFLSLDVKDAVIAIAGFIYGPIAAPIIALIAAFLEFVTFSTTGWYGFVMNFASSAAFALAVSLIYKLKKSFTGAMIGFLVTTLTTTGVMLLLNILVTPVYLRSIGVPNPDVISMIPRILMPFNFAKALLNSAVAMLLYKPVITALRRAKLIEGGTHKTEFNKTTVITLATGGTALLLGILIVVLINIYS